MSEIKAKAVFCHKDTLCNTGVHFLIVELQDREKVNNAAFQLHLEEFTGLYMTRRGLVPYPVSFEICIRDLLYNIGMYGDLTFVLACLHLVFVDAIQYAKNPTWSKTCVCVCIDGIYIL